MLQVYKITFIYLRKYGIKVQTFVVLKVQGIGLWIIRPLQSVWVYISVCINYQHMYTLLQIIKGALSVNLITLLDVLMLMFSVISSLTVE